MIGTPIATTTKHNMDETGSFVEQKMYRSMSGSLLYLTSSHQILCLVQDFVQDFNPLLKNSI